MNAHLRCVVSPQDSAWFETCSVSLFAAGLQSAAGGLGDLGQAPIELAAPRTGCGDCPAWGYAGGAAPPPPAPEAAAGGAAAAAPVAGAAATGLPRALHACRTLRISAVYLSG